MVYENYSNKVVEKAFSDELEKDELFASLREYISQYEQTGDIEYRMGMAYQFAGIMGSDLYRDHLSKDAQIEEALAVCGRLEIDREADSEDWKTLKTLLGL